MNKLSIVIPAYNEENRISKTLDSVDGFFRNNNFQYEIIVVNDGSKDKTASVVQSLLPRISNLKLINNQDNHGKGYVVRQGMLASMGDVRLFMDADNSTSIEQVLNMLPYLDQGFDLVIGSIEMVGATVEENAQSYRRILGYGAKYVIRFFSGLSDINDTQRGFKLFTAAASEKIFSMATIDRFGFDIEVLVLAKKLGYKIKEVPVAWKNSDESTVSLYSYAETLFELFRIRLNLLTGIYRI
ncbi:MAG: dolichyl-phosphate beta-glucosyltransferase [bacterium]